MLRLLNAPHTVAPKLRIGAAELLNPGHKMNPRALGTMTESIPSSKPIQGVAIQLLPLPTSRMIIDELRDEMGGVYQLKLSLLRARGVSIPAIGRSYSHMQVIVTTFDDQQVCKTSPVMRDERGNVDFDDFFILERNLEDDDEVIYISIYLIDQVRRRGMGFRSASLQEGLQESRPACLVSSASVTLGTAREYAVEEEGFKLKLTVEDGEGGGIAKSVGHHGHLELVSACR